MEEIKLLPIHIKTTTTNYVSNIKQDCLHIELFAQHPIPKSQPWTQKHVRLFLTALIN